MKLVSTLTWSERNINLGDVPFRRSAFPHAVDPLEILDRKPGARVIVLAPPQAFKSLIGQLWLLRNICISPARSAWYSDTEPAVKRFADAKISTLIERTKALQDRHWNDVDKRGSKMMIRFPDVPITLVSAAVRSARNQDSYEHIVCDEAWQYIPGAIAEIEKRADSAALKWKSKMYLPSTGAKKGSELETLTNQSTGHVYHCVCPHCGQQIPMEPGDATTKWGLKWEISGRTQDEMGRWDAVACSKTAHYICPKCEGRIDYSERAIDQMNRIEAGAGYVQTNPNPAENWYSYRVTGLCLRDWPSIVLQWTQAFNALARGDMSLMEELWLKIFVKAFNPAVFLSESNENLEAKYLLGEKWEDEHIRFMTVDVQKDHFWVLVRAWSQDGRSRLLHYSRALTIGEVADLATKFGLPYGEWHALDLLGRRIEIVNTRVLLDAANNKELVIKLCNAFGFSCCVGTGTRKDFLHEDKQRRIYADPPDMIDPDDGEARNSCRRVLRWLYSSDSARERLSLLQAIRRPDGELLWTYAKDASGEYRKQLAAEIREQRLSPRTGQPYWVWRRVEKDNHAFDCEVMQILLASITGLIGAESVETKDKDKPSAVTNDPK